MTNHTCLVEWHLAGIYSHPEAAYRLDSWDLLRSLKGSDEIPWLVVRDFNEILSMVEKHGVEYNQINRWKIFVKG